MRRILVLAGVILLSVFVLACHSHAVELRDLHDLNELRAMVDHDKTVPRLVLLLSPT